MNPKWTQKKGNQLEVCRRERGIISPVNSSLLQSRSTDDKEDGPESVLRVQVDAEERREEGGRKEELASLQKSVFCGSTTKLGLLYSFQGCQ